MSEDQLKTFISNAHVQPVRVCMDDGRSFTISHPDFAFVANDWLILASGTKQHLGNDGLALLPFGHISGVHIAKKKSKAAA
jgi:hypothetical protein